MKSKMNVIYWPKEEGRGAEHYAVNIKELWVLIREKYEDVGPNSERTILEVGAKMDLSNNPYLVLSWVEPEVVQA